MKKITPLFLLFLIVFNVLKVKANNSTLANNDEVTTEKNVSVDGNVLENDTDPEGDVQTIDTTPVSYPTNGTLVLNPNGTFTYTPVTDYVGTDSFEYKVCDNGTPSACDTATVVIIVKETTTPLTVTTILNNVTCYNSCDGKIEATATGGYGNYQYALKKDGSVIVDFSSNSIFVNLCDGIYQVEVVDANGYLAVSSDIIISSPSQLTGGINTTNTGNEAGGVIKVTTTGGTPPYIYSLDSYTYTNSNIFTNLSEGNYTVYVKDANGCLLFKEATITKVNADNTIDRNGNVLTVNFNGTAFQWINADTNTPINEATQQSFTVTEAGKYRVEITVNNSGRNKSKQATEVISSPIITITEASLSVNLVALKSLKLYPNPTERVLVFSRELVGIPYKIITVLGTEISSEKLKNTTINIEKLPKGIYFLKAKGYKPFKFLKK